MIYFLVASHGKESRCNPSVTIIDRVMSIFSLLEVMTSIYFLVASHGKESRCNPSVTIIDRVMSIFSLLEVMTSRFS